jgi:hypothetical protein
MHFKQEAIKWVKHMRRMANDKYTMTNDFIKFFNLTEDDLTELEGGKKKDDRTSN